MPARDSLKTAALLQVIANEMANGGRPTVTPQRLNEFARALEGVASTLLAEGCAS